MPKPKITSRLFWGEETANLPQLDLTLIQRESYQWFLKDGIFESLQEISPIEDFTGKNWILEFGKHVIGKPKHTPSQALEKGFCNERLAAHKISPNKKPVQNEIQDCSSRIRER